jgi:hypothetical protein
MYDTNSRLIVTHRIAEDRMAEARREHLLRGDDTGYQAHDRTGTGRSVLGRVASALRHAPRATTTHRPAYR